MHCGSLQELPRHLIHRDAHTGNMLFEDTGFVGWVDFDHLETNFRIFDVCYCGRNTVCPIHGHPMAKPVGPDRPEDDGSLW